MVKFRSHPGAVVQELPLCAMTSEQVIAAALYVGHETTAVQAARQAVLTCCSDTRRIHRRRAKRREMLAAGLQANAVPGHLWKYAGRAAWIMSWFIPPQWRLVVEAVLWVVDQLAAERDDETIRTSKYDAEHLAERPYDLRFTPEDEEQYRTACRNRGDSEREIGELPRRMRIRYAMADAIRSKRMDPQWLS